MDAMRTEIPSKKEGTGRAYAGLKISKCLDGARTKFLGAMRTGISFLGIWHQKGTYGTKNKEVRLVVELDQVKYTLGTYNKPLIEVGDSL